MTRCGLRVIKLGGSLLAWPAWPGQFRQWLAMQETSVNGIVVGGGALVERLRDLDDALGLSAETAHWLAIRAMGITARLAVELLPGAKLVSWNNGTGVPAAGENRVDPCFVFDVEEFLRQDKNAADALPASWDVTSDSIAARVASALGACELVLLKSSLPAPGATRQMLTESGYVDAHFWQAARPLNVRFVDLRDSQFGQIMMPAD